MAGEVLAKLLAEAKGNPSELSDIVFGKVTSISPLSVMVDNRFEVSGDFLILSAMVQDLKVKISIPVITASTRQVNSVGLNGTKPDVTKDVEKVTVVNQVNVSQQVQEIQIFRPLQVDDQVRMLRVQNGQLYYVLERSG
ncbi:DUF2577 domain-containing protein [Bacillaceae bacterium Marseille-Q3522]|nr:DUF2577 domain-containing protein [Bacillaceae bacterium Marseille-Q3522]